MLISANLFAAQFTINPMGNLTYSPQITNATIGDTIHIGASNTHPAVEVSMATYNANGNTPLPGGFGLHSSNFDLVLSNVGTIYFVCNNHHGSGMKGQIVVTAAGVHDIIEVNDIKFLSNPSLNGHIAVKNTLQKSGVLYLYNILGKLQRVERLNGEESQVIDVDLPAGNYLCKFILEGNWTRTEKLIITDQMN